MPAVIAEDVGRTYGDTVALDGVSLSIEAGEVFALVGPNGAGKTTLVRALTGTTDAEGTVTLFGEGPRAVDRQRLGVLPQSFSPHARLTARELVAYYAGLYEDARAVDDVLADVGMAEDADTWYENLSGGQQRRTCLGTTLVNDPDLLVLDEPTTGIDPAGRHALWSLLEDLAGRGVTVILTTHSMQEASRLANRVALLDDGNIVACDAPDALVRAHGGEPTLSITGTETEAAIAALSRPADAIEDGVVVRDIAATEIGDVVATLEAAGVAYGAVSWSEPDLEDVYMTLAGEDGDRR